MPLRKNTYVKTAKVLDENNRSFIIDDAGKKSCGLR